MGALIKHPVIDFDDFAAVLIDQERITADPYPHRAEGRRRQVILVEIGEPIVTRPEGDGQSHAPGPAAGIIARWLAISGRMVAALCLEILVVVAGAAEIAPLTIAAHGVAGSVGIGPVEILARARVAAPGIVVACIVASVIVIAVVVAREIVAARRVRCRSRRRGGRRSGRRCVAMLTEITLSNSIAAGGGIWGCLRSGTWRGGPCRMRSRAAGMWGGAALFTATGGTAVLATAAMLVVMILCDCQRRAGNQAKNRGRDQKSPHRIISRSAPTHNMFM